MTHFYSTIKFYTIELVHLPVCFVRFAHGTITAVVLNLVDLHVYTAVDQSFARANTKCTHSLLYSSVGLASILQS